MASVWQDVYHDWGRTLRRGQQQVTRFLKDPTRRVDPALESQGPRERHPPAREDSSTFPAFLKNSQPPVPICRNKPMWFYTLPPELRVNVCNFCIDYPHCRDLFDCYYNQRTRRHAEDTKGKQSLALMVQPNSGESIRFYTPTILLICKKITLEALCQLYTHTFLIDRIPPWVMGNGQPLPITDFMPKFTLQSLRYLEIRISLGEGSGSGRVWLKMLVDLLLSLGQHSLIKVKVVFKIKGMRNWFIWPNELHYYDNIRKKVR
jgi:hypothetical protein